MLSIILIRDVSNLLTMKYLKMKNSYIEERG